MDCIGQWIAVKWLKQTYIWMLLDLNGHHIGGLSPPNIKQLSVFIGAFLLYPSIHPSINNQV